MDNMFLNCLIRRWPAVGPLNSYKNNAFSGAAQSDKHRISLGLSCVSSGTFESGSDEIWIDKSQKMYKADVYIGCSNMVRTQIYLTEEERMGLHAMAAETGKKQAELIREAVDHLIHLSSKNRRHTVLTGAAGMWKDRQDLPDFAAIRKSLDRS